ncbi:MAG: hypothetical protein ACOC9Z_04805, partial [Chloroflexota bacterium]
LTPLIGERERQLVMDAVYDFFRPEFLNRLDDIIFFHQLTPDHLANILDLMLKKELDLAQRQGIHLDVSPDAKEWMLAQNDQPQFGARPLRRIISRHLREPLADFLLTAQHDGDAVIAVDASEEKLAFRVNHNRDQSLHP